MAGGHGFAIHGDVTLSRGWLCQEWKPLDIPGAHLHYATQLLNDINLTGALVEEKETAVTYCHSYKE